MRRHYSLDRSFKRRDNIFGESIIRRSGGGVRRPKVESPRWVYLLVLLFVFALLGVGRLADLQLIRGSYFRSLADGNRVRRIPIRASRGDIVDRNGKSLARNIPIYRLAEFSPGGIVMSSQKIAREEAIRIQASEPELETRLLVDIEREYPLGEAGAHLVGYVNEAGSEEIGDLPENCPGVRPYSLGDLIGRMGVEAQFECYLRGVDGEELIEVDTRGRIIRRLGRREPIPGKTLVLSVDSDMQKAAYEALIDAPNEAGTAPARESGKVVRGAFVAQRPETGEILALVSVPSFNPSTLASEYGKIATDQSLPLFNRVLSGAYHPGSTFKLVTSAASLEDQKVTPDFLYNDTGVVEVNNFSYKNWYFTQYGKTEGEIDLAKALARSTDTYFYYAGGLLGPERIAYWADQFGYGKKTGVDLPGEIAGLLPTPDWKLQTKKERWFLGNTYHMSIGQGDLTATPIQVNRMTAAVFNEGKICVPRVTRDGETRCSSINIKSETLGVIHEGMLGACSAGGTAYPFFEFKPQVACKTGTAQTVGDQLTHAWLTAVAPVDPDKKTVSSGGLGVVATALVEEGGEGSRVAAPVVRRVFEKVFSSH